VENKPSLSAWTYVRIFEAANILADINRKEQIDTFHLSEVFQYRRLDQNLT
jgi:predicted ATPase with chaperone activity